MRLLGRATLPSRTQLYITAGCHPSGRRNARWLAPPQASPKGAASRSARRGPRPPSCGDVRHPTKPPFRATQRKMVSAPASLPKRSRKRESAAARHSAALARSRAALQQASPEGAQARANLPTQQPSQKERKRSRPRSFTQQGRAIPGNARDVSSIIGRESFYAVISCFGETFRRVCPTKRDRPCRWGRRHMT